MKYLPLGTTDESYGWTLSAAIWRLSRPEADQDSTTRHYVAPKAHPDTGEVYFPIDEDDSQPIHANAEPGNVTPMLGKVPEDKRNEIEERINEARGGRARVIDFFPSSFRSKEIDGKDWPKPDVRI